MTQELPIRLVVIHRGELPPTAPDPWSARTSSRVNQLARAVATSRGWANRGRAVLLVRDAPDPVIAALGRFDDATMAWLTAASAQLAGTLPHVRPLDHAGVEASCRRLASALAGRFGLDALRTFRYTAVPRGGHFVLGSLAYVLDLPRERLLAHDDAGAGIHAAPLVVVDDVAVSGVRLAQFIDRRHDPNLIVATLHAHPALRSAFTIEHPRVEAFVSAHDLRDLAPELQGTAYADWVARWRARAEPSTVWVGQPERVAYPWSEPDVGVWNPVLQREEAGWNIMPPERCIKNQIQPGIEVQDGVGPLKPLRTPSTVVVGEVDGRVVFGRLGTGTVFELGGVGADVWRAWSATGDVEAAADLLADTYAVDRERLVADISALVEDLGRAGLLVEEHT